MRRSLTVAFCLLRSLAAVHPAAGQSLDPNGVVETPRPGGIVVELGYSMFWVKSFVTRTTGEENDFPGRLSFALGVLRVSYSPLRDLAAGVEIPYRWSRYADPGLDVSVQSRGSPGLGFFVDWSPASRAKRFLPAVRIEYLGARSETDRALTISDEVDRVAATLQVSALRGGLPADWTGIATLGFEYGLSAEIAPRHFESRVQVQVGPTLARLTSGDIHALLAVGYRQSASARQEGNFFHNRKSQGAFAGVVMEWDPSGGTRRGISLSALRDVWSPNALSGWRLGLSLKSFL